MGPIQTSDLIYLTFRLILAGLAIAAAVNAIRYARQDKPFHHRHLRLARVGALLLAVAGAMSCIDAVDNAIVRWNEPTPLSSWMWLFGFDFMLPIYAFLLVYAWRQRDRAEAELADMVVTDLLTGALNRRGFFERAVLAIEHARRVGQVASVAMLDIDNFKAINDRAGHAAGDAVLRRLAAVVSRELRPADVFGRLGGDEFAVLLPECDTDAALSVVERLRSRMHADVAQPAGEWAATISAGVAPLPDGIEPEPALAVGLGAADTALYAAKQAGRDRALAAPPPMLQEQHAALS
jgi:diguanylate cyclase